MLTKKDYVELARIIRESTVKDIYHHPRYLTYDIFMNELYKWLRMDNPNFDESRFRAAALPSEGESKPQMTKRR